jgi:hypothetical protein
MEIVWFILKAHSQWAFGFGHRNVWHPATLGQSENGDGRGGRWGSTLAPLRFPTSKRVASTLQWVGTALYLSLSMP